MTDPRDAQIAMLTSALEEIAADCSVPLEQCPEHDQPNGWRDLAVARVDFAREALRVMRTAEEQHPVVTPEIVEALRSAPMSTEQVIGRTGLLSSPTLQRAVAKELIAHGFEAVIIRRLYEGNPRRVWFPAGLSEQEALNRICGAVEAQP